MLNSKILILCSTIAEAQGFIEVSIKKISDHHFAIKPNIHLLISGIGIQKTTFNLTKVLLENSYDLVINFGLAGVYENKLELGSLVNIMEEVYADLGVISHKNIHTIFDLNLESANEFPFSEGILRNKTIIPEFFQDLPTVKGATVNSLYTSEISNFQRVESFGVQVETMEGAAVFYVCSMLKIPFLQIRAISNVVGERDKSKWAINSTIQKLNSTIASALEIDI